MPSASPEAESPTLRRRLSFSSVFCLRSSTVLRMRCMRASCALVLLFTERGCCLDDILHNAFSYFVVQKHANMTGVQKSKRGTKKEANPIRNSTQVARRHELRRRKGCKWFSIQILSFFLCCPSNFEFKFPTKTCRIVLFEPIFATKNLI